MLGGTSPDQYGSLLIPVIMIKLQSEIHFRISCKASRNAWKINTLLKILKQEVEAREVSEGSTIKTPVVQQPRRDPYSTTSALVANNCKVHP